MTKNLAAWLFLCAAGCATTRNGPPLERLSAPDPRHGIPPTSPEMDPANTEQRFGFAEAKARKEAKAQAERDQHQHLGVTSVGGGSTAPSGSPPAAQTPPCPCDAASAPHAP